MEALQLEAKLVDMQHQILDLAEEAEIILMEETADQD
jgi:hypothetical protein